MKVQIAQKINPNEDLITQILNQRALSLSWLDANKKDFNDGTQFKNFELGKNLIQKHMYNSISLIVDQDTDGFCSAAIMYLWLKDKNPDVKIEVILAEGKTHGIIHDLIPKDLDLLIIPDASSNEADSHTILTDAGVDILILDHHEFEDTPSDYNTSREDLVIINPHNPTCPYPNKNLSGAGVVWKFLQAIDEINNEEDYMKYIDLAAIATIGDVMDSTEMENKAIINMGLQNITNPYFIAYLKADQRLKDKTTNPIVISFYLVPQINGLIRMGTVEDKRELFEALVGETPPEPVVASIIKIKAKQDRKQEPIITRIVFNLKRENAENYPVIFTEAPLTTPKSMTGLIAGKLTSIYMKPVFIGHVQEVEGVPTMVGSLRNVNNSNVENLKDFCEESELFNWAKGHQSAAGFSIPVDNIPKFIEYCEENLPPFEKTFYVDFQLSENRSNLIEEVCKLDNHAGPGFPEILIYDEVYVTPEDFKIIGKKENTLIIEHEDLTYIEFNSRKDIPEEPGILRIVGKPNLNEWMGSITPQIIIKEWEWVPLAL